MDVKSHIINIQVECSLAYINKAVTKDDKDLALWQTYLWNGFLRLGLYKLDGAVSLQKALKPFEWLPTILITHF